MASIIIKELYDGDNILGLVEKVNFNFDQLMAAGGGPEGPIGLSGPTGPAGARGIRGSEWFAGTGASGTINVPTDGELRDNDFRLDSFGEITYYLGGIWTPANINITGPPGPQGDVGDGSISVIHSEASTSGFIIPNETDNTKLKLSTHLIKVDSNNDTDDYDFNNAGYLNAGIDYTVIGYGNNSMVLGRYESIFRINGSLEPHFTNWPTEEAAVPMLIVAQNDYKQPEPGTVTDELSDFENGLAIGLNNTQATYDPLYADVDEFKDYTSFTRLRTINRNYDFGIKSPGSIEIASRGSNLFRLSSGYTKTPLKSISSITDWSNYLSTDSYTEIKAGDNVVLNVKASNQSDIFASSQIIGIANTIAISSELEEGLSGSILTSKNTTFIGRNDNSNAASTNANELVIVNNQITPEQLTSDKYNKKIVLDPNNFSLRDANDYTDTKLRIGQARLSVNASAATDTAMNFFYMGQAFDTPIVGYSSANFRVPTGTKAMGASAAAWSLLPPTKEDMQVLGYDIQDGFALSDNDVDTDRSLTRLGIFPGFFNQKKDVTGALDPSDPSGRANFERYIDDGHKKLPSGSIDLYGTVRIRENGNAEDKTGYVAVNAGHGILKWEEENKVGVGTGAIIMISELAMSKFNFFSSTQKVAGSTSGQPGTAEQLSYWVNTYSQSTGGTALQNVWSMAFPGKGSEEWDGYYICNGAILADTRDVFGRGFFSTEKGLNVYSSDKPRPNIQKNTEYYEHFDEYDQEIAVSNTFSTNSDDFADNYLSFSNNHVNVNGNAGLSILSPIDNDSQFRVVLPNYFGRFPKQMFPSSETLEFSFRDNDADPTPVSRYPTLTYYKVNSSGKYVINSKWPLRSGFYDGGFPYIRTETLPIHEHWVGSIIPFREGTGTTKYMNMALNPSQYNEPFGLYASDTTGMPAHGTKRNVGAAANNPKEYYMNRDYETTRLSNFSNIETTGGLNNRAQKFNDPVFRGTYFAIKLKGLRNPNLGNTLIPDFDYVAGVPLAGYRNDTLKSTVRDLSWYSDSSTVGQRTSTDGPGTTDISIVEVTANVVTKNITPVLGAEAIKEFTAIRRNENTMHPYTLMNTSPTQSYSVDLELLYKNVYIEPEI